MDIIEKNGYKLKSYKFRIYPTQKQTNVLSHSLLLCQRLYNTALEHRITAYKNAGKNISYNVQQNELPELKEMFPQYLTIHSQVLQDVLHRVDFAFKGFFRRLKINKEKAGFPRFKSLDRYNSFCFPQNGFSIKSKRVELSKIGLIKTKFHRDIPLDYKPKTCIIKADGKKWYVIFACESPKVIAKKKTGSNTVGIDLGLTSFVVLSNGTEVKNPKYLRLSERALKETQSRYSNGRSKKIKLKLTRLHSNIANQRKDFQHKLSHYIANTFDIIVYEDLKVKLMIEDNNFNLQKHIYDASWSTFISMLKYKAENAGTSIIAVNPKGTTQRCSNCDAIVQKSLYVRLHTCTFCGLSVGRDYNAALNIHKLGINLVKEGVA